MRPESSSKQIKSDGALSVQWKRVLRVRAPSREETKYEWNEAAVVELGIPKRKFMEGLRPGDEGSAAAAVVWSS